MCLIVLSIALLHGQQLLKLDKHSMAVALYQKVTAEKKQALIDRFISDMQELAGTLGMYSPEKVIALYTSILEPRRGEPKKKNDVYVKVIKQLTTRPSKYPIAYSIIRLMTLYQLVVQAEKINIHSETRDIRKKIADAIDFFVPKAQEWFEQLGVSESDKRSIITNFTRVANMIRPEQTWTEYFTEQITGLFAETPTYDSLQVLVKETQEIIGTKGTKEQPVAIAQPGRQPLLVQKKVIEDASLIEYFVPYTEEELQKLISTPTPQVQTLLTQKAKEILEKPIPLEPVSSRKPQLIQEPDDIMLSVQEYVSESPMPTVWESIPSELVRSEDVIVPTDAEILTQELKKAEELDYDALTGQIQKEYLEEDDEITQEALDDFIAEKFGEQSELGMSLIKKKLIQNLELKGIVKPGQFASVSMPDIPGMDRLDEAIIQKIADVFEEDQMINNITDSEESDMFDAIVNESDVSERVDQEKISDIDYDVLVEKIKPHLEENDIISDADLTIFINREFKDKTDIEKDRIQKELAKRIREYKEEKKNKSLT